MIDLINDMKCYVFFTAIELFTITDIKTCAEEVYSEKTAYYVLSRSNALVEDPRRLREALPFPCEHDTFLFMLRITTGLVLHHQTTSSV